MRLPGKEKRGTFPMKMKWYDRLLAALCALVLLAAAVFAVGAALGRSARRCSALARCRALCSGFSGSSSP